MLIFFKAKILFPAWELFIPSVGIFCSQYGNNFHVMNEIFSRIIALSLHAYTKLLEMPLNKGNIDFLSLHKAYTEPTQAYITVR